MRNNYRGLLLIGDPHLSAHNLNFRSDDNFAKTILGKLKFCINYAKENNLLPALLGDFFDRPRDNPTWIINELLRMLETEVIGIYGNHDCRYNDLTEHDSLSILVTAGAIRLLHPDDRLQLTIGGRETLILGSSYRIAPPKAIELATTDNAPKPVVIWLTHHDIKLGGYSTPYAITPREVKNVDVVVNGHIHTKAEPVEVGKTLWLNPGNITRRSRSLYNREKIPSALELLIKEDDIEFNYIGIPHAPFDEVFHIDENNEGDVVAGSEFVAGLAELQKRATESGAGLMEFLNKNIDVYDKETQEVIMELAQEVTDNKE